MHTAYYIQYKANNIGSTASKCSRVVKEALNLLVGSQEHLKSALFSKDEMRLNINMKLLTKSKNKSNRQGVFYTSKKNFTH